MSESFGGLAIADDGRRGGRAQQRPASPPVPSGGLPGLPAFRHTARLDPVRAIPVGADMRGRLMAVWPGLMLRKFSSDAQNAAAFGVERQTATYWRNGDTGPNGAAVALAWLLWPGEMADLLAGVR